MKRHTHKHIKIVGVSLAIISVVGFVVEFTVPTLAKTTQTKDVDVSFTFNPTLSMQVGGDGQINIGDVSPGATKESSDVNVTVGTNNASGYYLSATAGNQTSSDLTSGTSGGKITHLSSDDAGKELAALSDNSWAVMVTGGDSAVSNGKYIGLPKEIGGSDKNAQATAGKKLVDASGPATSKVVKVKVGVKIGKTLPAGTYKSYLNFYAVTK